MISRAWLAALLLAIAITGAAPARRPAADLVLRHGRIVTMERGLPEVQALAARGDTILALGSDAEIAPWVGPRTRVIDLGGRLVTPGFIDSHGHFMGLGASLRRLRLAPAKNWDEITAMVAAAARTARPGEWILGRGWHQEKWDRAPLPSVEGFPTHEALSRVAPRHPVLLTHASGHAVIANAEAMRLAGIDRNTPNPEGGEILKDKDGAPTGLLRENAADLVTGAMERWLARRTPRRVEEDALRDIELASAECLSKGVTSFQDAGSPRATIERFERLSKRRALKLRLWVMAREDNDVLERNMDYYRTLVRGRWLSVRAIKRQIDGALGSRGAWLLEPYTDAPDQRGLNTAPLDDLRRTAEIAERAGFQLCIHAIGDRANREVLDLYQDVFRAHPEPSDRRWRIEHAQHLSPSDIPRFARLGVIASMQGIHCTSDGPWVPARIGDTRAREGAYVWRKLIDSGALVVNGTDTPVESVDPIRCYEASVTRRLPDGKFFYPEQKMTREEALASYTRAAAYAGFEERIKGTLAVGKLADVVVLSQDLLTVPDERLGETRVDYTIVGGRVAYARNAGASARSRAKARR
jgi:predicted amidohydrolase YtcJ